MFRFAFLIIVVIGALALLMGLIFGMGVAKVAVVNRPAEAPASRPATAESPGTRPAIAGATTEPGTASPIAIAAAVPPGIAPVPPVGPAPLAQPVPPAPAVFLAPPAPDAPFVLGTILLRGADAKLKGKLIAQTPPDGDITSWTQASESATWVFAPKAGKYFVDLTRSNGANSSGKFRIDISGERGVHVNVAGQLRTTGGWNAFRTDRIGIIDLPGGRTVLTVMPTEEPQLSLMHLRKIELVPVEPAAVAAAAPRERGKHMDENAPAILGLTIVDAATGRPLGTLTNGSRLDLSTLAPISIRVETTDNTAGVQFLENGDAKHALQGTRPFSIAGVRGNVYTPWKPPPGKMSLTVLASGDKAQPGKKLSVHIEILSRAGHSLSAEDAILHGDEIQLEQEEPPVIAAWRRSQEWIEWETGTIASGRYKVQLVYACENGSGGEFVMRVADAKLTGTIEGTGGWMNYKTIDIGQVDLKRGRARVAIKPADLPPGHALMKLREVRLMLAEERK